VVYRVEGGGEVEQRQDGEVSIVHCTKNVRQNLLGCRCWTTLAKVSRSDNLMKMGSLLHHTLVCIFTGISIA
jgi:hypothetical protein